MLDKLTTVWFRSLCWFLILTSPVFYVFLMFLFTLAKVFDWYGTPWGMIFSQANESFAEIWSYARYGR